jgi:hypothetical protein
VTSASSAATRCSICATAIDLILHLEYVQHITASSLWQIARVWDVWNEAWGGAILGTPVLSASLPQKLDHLQRRLQFPATKALHWARQLPTLAGVFRT